MKLMFRGGNKVNIEKLGQATKSVTQDVIENGMKNGGADFYKEVGAGKFPGLTIKTTGKFIAVEVLSRSLLEAIRKKDLGAFPETLSNSNIWIEAIPGVGSYKSMGRLFSENGDPVWLKITDAGINLLGDGILLAGIAGSVFLLEPPWPQELPVDPEWKPQEKEF